MNMNKKPLIVLIMFFICSSFTMFSEEPPMEGSNWHNDAYKFTKFYSTSYQYQEQDGYALVLGRKLHYWLYDSITYKSYHGGDTAIIYNRIIPNWVEKMGYVIDYDNIEVYEPNNNLATSVRTLMKQRGANISVALCRKVDGNASKTDHVVINEYFPSKNQYKTTIYYLYK